MLSKNVPASDFCDCLRLVAGTRDRIMRNRQYDWLLLGATTFSCVLAGRLTRAGARVAVVETTSLAGYEFAEGAFGGPYRREAYGKNGRALYDRLVSCDALDRDGGALNFPVLAPVSCEYLRDSGADCYFLTRIGRLCRQDGRYIVSLFSLGGETIITATRIVDTTADMQSGGWFGVQMPTVPYRIGIQLTVPETSCTFTTYPDPSGQRVYGELYLPRPMSVAQARVYATDIMRRDPAAFGGGQIVDFGSFTCARPTGCCRTLGSKAVWNPSLRYPDVFSAADAAATFPDELPDGPSLPAGEEHPEGLYDLVVAGLGTAGSVCAIAAARDGMRVLAVEAYAIPGGASVAGAVLRYYQDYGGGLYRALDKEAEAYTKGCFLSRPVDGSSAKGAYLAKALSDAGVVCRYDATATGVIRDGNRITGLRYVDRFGVHTVSARVVADATADGVLCIAAGCEMLPGRAVDGRFMPYSAVTCHQREDCFDINYSDCGVVNQYDPDALAEAVLFSGTDRAHCRAKYNRTFPVFSGAVPLIGLRGGLRIAGEETLHFSQLFNGGFTDRPIFYSHANFDDHGKDHAFEDPDCRDWLALCGLWGYGADLPVPMGALIPKDTDGLLAVGRHFSVDHSISLGVRMMGDVCKAGEAAAYMAHLAIANRCPLKDIPYEPLHARLTASGALSANAAPSLYRQGGDDCHPLIDTLFLTEERDITAGLASDLPGLAIWSCRRASASVLEAVRCLYQQHEKERVRRNAALALAMADDPTGVPLLLNMAAEPDTYVPRTSRRYVSPMAVSAICALGRLAVPDAAQCLAEIATEPMRFVSEVPLPETDLIADRDDFAFQLQSHAVTALAAIRRRHPETEELCRPVSELLARPDYRASVSMMWSGSVRCDVTETMRRVFDL